MGKKQSYKFIGNIDKVFQTEEITTIFQELDVKAIQNARVGSQDIASVDVSWQENMELGIGSAWVTGRI